MVLRNTRSGDSGELIAAALFTRLGFLVIQPFWNDDDVDLIVLAPVHNTFSVIPVQVKARQGEYTNVTGLKKKYLYGREELLLFAYRPREDITWIIPRASAIRKYYSKQVAAANALKRPGGQRKRLRDIDDNKDVPVRFNPVIGVDAASDRWLLDRTDARAVSQQIRTLSGIVQSRRYRKWSSASPFPVVALPAKRAAVAATAAQPKVGPGLRRFCNVAPEWQKPCAGAFAAASLIRAGLDVGVPVIPGTDGDLFVFVKIKHELIPVRVYVSPAQGDGAKVVSIDVTRIDKRRDRHSCLAIYCPPRDKLWFLPTGEVIRNATVGSAGQRILVDVSTKGDQAFDNKWQITDPRQLRVWIQHCARLTCKYEQDVYAIRKAFSS